MSSVISGDLSTKDIDHSPLFSLYVEKEAVSLSVVGLSSAHRSGGAGSGNHKCLHVLADLHKLDVMLDDLPWHRGL